SCLSDAPPPTPASALSLHDALPISRARPSGRAVRLSVRQPLASDALYCECGAGRIIATKLDPVVEPEIELLQEKPQVRLAHMVRSEEHTSELQSPYDIVCRLLLEKK